MLEIGCRVLGSETGHAAGRALLAEMYRRRTGGNMPEIAVTERGKPYFADSPLHFSISHTKHRVFCALADVPVGLDAEETDRAVSPLLAKKVLSPGEYAQYAAAADKPQALLRFWVLKEALVKATGEGLRGYPNHTDFSLNDPRVSIQDGCLVAVISLP